MAEQKTRDPMRAGESKNDRKNAPQSPGLFMLEESYNNVDGESKRGETAQKDPDYVIKTDPKDLDLQVKAILNLCKAYNEKVMLSEMRFYPQGGYLYRYFYEREKCNIAMPECYQTEDVDGRLMVVPRGMTDNQLKRAFDMSRESVEAIMKEAYDKVLNKTSGWLDTPAGEKYTLDLGPGAFEIPDDYGDAPILTFNQVPVFNEDYLTDTFDHLSWDFGMLIKIHGATEQLDLHFGFLKPPTNAYMFKEYDIMYGAKPADQPEMFLMTKQHFMVDQLETAFTRLYDFFALAVIDQDRNPNTWQLKKVLGNDKVVRKKFKKNAKKAMKTVCRVKNFIKMYSELSTSTLEDLYKERDDMTPNPLTQRLMCNSLKRRVGEFNALVMQEQNNASEWYRIKRYPKNRDANGRINITQYDKVVRTNRLVCDDMTLGQVVMVLEHMSDSIRHQGEQAIADAIQMNRANFRQTVFSAYKLKETFKLSLRF